MELSKEELRKLQNIEYDMLCEVDRICRKNGIKYTLYAGTVLGAVRHNGFIPWDDDADVAFLPDEYEKFFEACKTDLNTEKFFFQDYRTDEYYRWGYGKMRRNNSAFVREGQEHMNFHNGICIDVFKLFYLPNNIVLRKLYFFLFLIIRKTLYSEVGKETEKNKAIRLIYKMLYKIPKRMVFSFVDKMRIKQPSDFIHHLFIPTKRTKYGIPRAFFDGYTYLPFEGRQFMVMRGYEEYLRASFADYTQLPPLEKRETHNPASKIIFPDD